MRKIMGIDTGGTYTDGVIIRAEDREILAKTKTLTTRRSLQKCILNCMDGFSPEQLQGVELVCLSTTLATNAVVEGRGCREGLLLIGGRPEGRMPTERYRIVQGRTDIMGRLREPLDWQQVDEAIESFRGSVDAMAVSGYASVRNPAHERQVKERIREKLGVPVVCAHELTATLGFYERTVTAVLNARLIPLLCGLIDSVRQAMERAGIRAPLMIVRGDGTLMTEDCARDKPIETILSGPAASVIGGQFLSGLNDALVLDMGGTTTDLANITGGSVRMNDQGASVGGWLPRVRATEIYTVGLGGDSRIWIDGSRKLVIGPRKVIPYCVAATWFPALCEELGELLGHPQALQFCRNESEAYMVTRYDDPEQYSPDERQVLRAIEKQPHTLFTLQEQCRMSSLLKILEKLMDKDVVARIALTPTDVLHVEGSYSGWNRQASQLALLLLGGRLGLDEPGCIDLVRQTMARQLARACIRGSFYFDHAGVDGGDQAADYFIDQVALDDRSGVLGGSFRLKKPVVAIGAPAYAWAGCIGRALGAQVIFPPHAEVANAVGAAVGQISQRAEILIRRDPVTHQYTVFSSECRECFATLEQATEQARRLGRRCARARLPEGQYQVSDQVDDVYVEDRITGGRQFVERRVAVTAVSGLPAGGLTVRNH